MIENAHIFSSISRTERDTHSEGSSCKPYAFSISGFFPVNTLCVISITPFAGGF